MKKHNGIVSVWKFIFAIVIAFFHTNGFYPNFENPIFRWGYIAVEFFFIVAGFYFAQKVLKEKYNSKTVGKEGNAFIFNKIKVFFIPIFVIYIINVILLIKYSDFNISQIFDVFWNAALLRNFGIGKVRIMRQLWFLGTMVLTLHILYPLLKKHKENFILLASPVIIILSLGLIGHAYGNLDISDDYWFYVINPSLFRTFADINIGMVLYLIHHNLEKIEYTPFFKLVLTILGEGLLIISLLVVTFIKSANRYDFILLLIISVAILIITSGKTYDYKILSNKFTAYLEKLSLYIFVNHMTLIYFVSVMYDTYSPFHKSILTIGITLVFSIIEERIVFLLKGKKNVFESLIVKNNDGGKK